jgi:hypothetical protein
MDNTKDLIKEHMAKIVAEEICKDQNVIEKLKAEILKNLLPTPVVETTPVTEPVQETKKEETETKKDFLSDFPILQHKSWKDLFEDRKSHHKDQLDKAAGFKFNPEKLPDWYKNKTKSPAQKTNHGFGIETMNWNNIPKTTTQPSYSRTYSTGFDLPKKEQSVKMKSTEEIFKDFIKAHEMPPDVAELLEKSKTEKPKIKRAARITAKPARKKAKKK